MGFQIGPRMIKTGIAVFLTLLLTDFLDTELRIVAVIASVLAMQPSIVRSWNYLKEVIVSNILAVLFAIGGLYVLGGTPISIGIVIILSIAINLKLGLNKTLNLTILAILAIMLSSTEEVNFFYILDRIELLVIGILSAFVVNVFVFPPKHQEIIYSHIKATGIKTNFLIKLLPEKAYQLKDIKKQIKEIEKEITKLKEYYQILFEERKRVFVKERGSFIREIIIYKQMIRVLEKELELIRSLFDNLKKVELISEKQTILSKKMIQELTRYQETIQLMYENKVIVKKDIDTESKKTMKLSINDLIKELKESDEENWYYIFSIANGIVDLAFETEKLERLVRRKRTFKPKKQPFKKIMNKIIS
jgi:uncharacterized membrane protein YgaE (UPF0421/DUF939 family)